MMEEKTVTARISRFDPTADEEPGFQEYTVPYQPGMTVLSLLRDIYDELDPALAFRDYRCGRGICGSCRVRLNGKPVKACCTTLDGESPVVVEPVNDRVIRDLTVVL